MISKNLVIKRIHLFVLILMTVMLSSLFMNNIASAQEEKETSIFFSDFWGDYHYYDNEGEQSILYHGLFDITCSFKKNGVGNCKTKVIRFTRGMLYLSGVDLMESDDRRSSILFYDPSKFNIVFKFSNLTCNVNFIPEEEYFDSEKKEIKPSKYGYFAVVVKNFVCKNSERKSYWNLSDSKIYATIVRDGIGESEQWIDGIEVRALRRSYKEK